MLCYIHTKNKITPRCYINRSKITPNIYLECEENKGYIIVM